MGKEASKESIMIYGPLGSDEGNYHDIVFIMALMYDETVVVPSGQWSDVRHEDEVPGLRVESPIDISGLYCKLKDISGEDGANDVTLVIGGSTVKRLDEAAEWERILSEYKVLVVPDGDVPEDIDSAVGRLKSQSVLGGYGWRIFSFPTNIMDFFI